MADRDRLIELISQVQYMGGLEGKLADHLLANGVIVPPCKVGDAVYIVAGISQSIVECVVIGCWTFGNKSSIITDYGSIHNDSIGKTVFLTKEEAEAKLKEMKGNG